LVPYKYSGAVLRSKKAFKYGYIEMRYKLSNIAPGNYNAYGPNLWMWNGGTDGINYYNEIDIFEQDGTTWNMDMNCHFCKMTPSYYNQHPGSNPSDTLFWNGKHCGGGTNPPYEPYAQYFTGPYNGGTWHTVGCEWTPEYIDNYYDSNDTIRRFSATKLPIIDQLAKMPLIIDCYMPALQYCTPFNDTYTVAPFNYDIDYIRVYQINQVSNCAYSSPVTFLNTSSATYESKLYKGLTIGGTGGSAVFSSGNHHLAAQDYVLLQEGFEVNGTANVTISTMKCQTGQTKDDNDYNTFDPNIINDIIKCKRH